MPRIKLVIEYDGSNYHGMQRQVNAHTVQAELEEQMPADLSGKLTSWPPDELMLGFMPWGR